MLHVDIIINMSACNLFQIYTFLYIFILSLIDISFYFHYYEYKIDKKDAHDTMKSEYTMENFLNMYYLDINIPMYVYTGNSFDIYVPSQTSLTFPPQKYIDILISNPDRISYCATDYGVYFGCLRLDSDATEYLIMGPVSNVPYSKKTLFNMYRDYVVSNENKDDFQIFLKRIPHISRQSLISKLVFLNYCIYKEVLTLSDFLSDASSSETFSPELARLNYDRKENYVYNKSYVLEEAVLKLVRTGNLEGFHSLQFNDDNFHTGVTGDNAIRQLKNNIIISTTLCTRAAIDGGLEYSTAYELSDHFIQVTEQTNNPDILYELSYKICYTFAEKVAQTQAPTSTDGRLQKAIQYIQQNTNQHITVGDVADYVGFSKSYFSAYFKENLGFTVSNFILRCRLEEGRRLLQFTNKSISTISTFLCFSSQSHFQTAFKKQFGMTPNEYRRKRS